MNVSQYRHLWLLAVLLGSMTLTSGCGDGRPTRVPVSGQVLYNGQPLQIGFVRVIPNKGRAATGKLDENGRFTLTTYEKGDGCLLGSHPVEIHSADNSREGISIPLIPAKYTNKATSGLSVTIDSPTDALVFELSGKPPLRRKRYVSGQ